MRDCSGSFDLSFRSCINAVKNVVLMKNANKVWVLCVSFRQQIYFTLGPCELSVNARWRECERKTDIESTLVTGFVVALHCLTFTPSVCVCVCVCV